MNFSKSSLRKSTQKVLLQTFVRLSPCICNVNESFLWFSFLHWYW